MMLDMNKFCEYLEVDVDVVEVDVSDPFKIFVMNIVTDKTTIAKKIIADEPLSFQEEEEFAEILEVGFKYYGKKVLEIVNELLENGELKPLTHTDYEFLTGLAIREVLLSFYDEYVANK